jgi:hypothetical protein
MNNNIHTYSEPKNKPFKTSNDIANDQTLMNQTQMEQTQMEQTQMEQTQMEQSLMDQILMDQSLMDQSPNNITIDKSKQRKVVFNDNVKVNFIEKSNSNSNTKSNSNSFNIHQEMYNALNHSKINYTDPDFINPDDELNDEHLIIEKDPTDIIDDDEQEILEGTESNSEEKTEYDYLIQKLFNTFLNKFPHLDNYKNKSIIYSMFKIAVIQMPEHINNPIFYLNFVESSIQQFTQPNLDDVISNGILN